MNDRTFRFSPGAMLYGKNLDIVTEIRESKSDAAQRLCEEYAVVRNEMREEAYRSIAEFGDLFLERLSAEPWDRPGLQLVSKKTYSVKSYAGASINYRWLEGLRGSQRAKAPFTFDAGMVYFAFPILEKLKNVSNDDVMRDSFGVFDLLDLARLNVWVGYESSNSQQKNKVLDIANNKEFGDFEGKEDMCCTMWLPLRADDPVGSAVERASALLRALYNAVKSG